MTPAPVDPQEHPDLPELPYEAWSDTLDTLRLFVQIVGKVKLAATHPRNHWWNVTFSLDARGLTTRRLCVDGVFFDIAFDFVDHRLVVRTDRGDVRTFALDGGLSVAGFDARLHGTLAGLGVDVPLREKPFGVPHLTTPFADDTAHATYDRARVERYWRALSWSADVLEEFTGWFTGKTSPVHVFWHSFDLAVTRFSGKRADPLGTADPVTAEAYSHEVVSFGWWAGDPKVPYPAYYSYTAPKPDGLAARPLSPAAAAWVDDGAMALLPYEAVRAERDPRRALLAFLQTAFEAGAGAAGWPADELTSSWCPTPEQLRALARSGLQGR
ncbi:DUF5996 family protein [Yinghuangia seranimata]|uniref:DUF5996 family protein n=1 Tax=Yinghuangia seranimata TaxID=408067 RepID=UPI00248B35F9|nr:DUF5996 family protein [Yinghuangia seranimata]MDI2125552.1 DUF5996 family protein [Yinghuangia seranimata]